MNPNTSALRIAFLCGSLLVTPAYTSAQQPETQNLQGSYALETPRPCEMIKKEIEATIKGMGFWVKRKARRKLRDGNLPAPRMINISYTANEVTISSLPSGALKTPLDGTFVKARRDAEDIEISTKWQGGKLDHTFRFPKEQKIQGQRVNAFSLRSDGKLLMQVTATSPHLKRSLNYNLVYTRTNTDDKDLAYEKYPDCQKGYDRKGHIVITNATKTAEKIVRDKFEEIKNRKMAHARKGYDPLEIIEALKSGKESLITDLGREGFEPVKAWVETAPQFAATEAELVDPSSGLVSEKSMDQALKNFRNGLSVLNNNSDLFELQVNSEPPDAFYEMKAGLRTKQTTTNIPVPEVRPGIWSYTVTKYGFKDIGPVDANLMNKIRRLHCVLIKKTDGEAARPCTEHRD